MSILGSDGKEAGKAAEAAPEAGQEKAPEQAPTFRADFNTPGLMKLEVNLEAISHDRKAQWMLMGFLDDHKAIAMTIVNNIISQRNQVRDALNKTQSKNGFRPSFFDKIRGR